MDVFNDVCGQCNRRLRGESFRRRVPRLGGKIRLVCPACREAIDAQTSLELLCTHCRRRPAAERRRIPTRGGALSSSTQPVCQSCAEELDQIAERLARSAAA